MIFTAPWGLLALVAIPAIIAIHLFRRRFPLRPIAGLFLWQSVQQTPEGGGKITRLPVTASLILECLAALALALILAGARLRPSSVNEHLVVLLDDSASMSAATPQGTSSRDRAISRVLSESGKLGRNARLTLVQSGERPSVLLGPAALAAEAEPALQNWNPRALHHSLALGLRLARQLGGKTGKLMVLSDALPDGPDARGGTNVEGVLWVSVGEPLANAGIIAGQRTLTPNEGKGAISLALENTSAMPARRRIVVTTANRDAKDAQEVLTRDLDLPPGKSSLNLPITPGLPALRVTLSKDALQEDNVVTLVEPKPQIVGVENHLPDGRGRLALTKALGTLAGVTPSDHGHLRFMAAADFDKPQEAGVWRVGFGRATQSMLGPGEAMDFIGPFVPEKRHPLLQGVTLGGVVWTGAWPLMAGLRPLVSAGDRPLLVLQDGRPENGIVFNIDLDRTNLIRSPDWPIVISNIVELRRQNLPGPERWNYRAGEWVRLRLGRDPKGELRYRCGDIQHDLPKGRMLEFVAPDSCPDRGGLLQVMEGADVVAELGVNFIDEDETNLSDRIAGEAGQFNPASRGLRTETGPASDPLFWILLATAGTAVLTNWCWRGPQRVRA